MARRNSFSAFGLRPALPKGCTILETGTIRLEPTIWAILVIEHICDVGSPARSSSFVSAAPQRVLVPQVEVKITPDTPSALSCLEIACPIFLTFSTILAHPAVE